MLERVKNKGNTIMVKIKAEVARTEEAGSESKAEPLNYQIWWTGTPR